MLHDAIGDNRSHVLIRVVDTLPAAEQQSESDRAGNVARVGGAELLVGHGRRIAHGVEPNKNERPHAGGAIQREASSTRPSISSKRACGLTLQLAPAHTERLQYVANSAGQVRFGLASLIPAICILGGNEYPEIGPSRDREASIFTQYASVGSVDEWIALSCRYRDDARALLDVRRPDRAWLNAGLSVECCIKAAIMRKERWNRWPDMESEPDLWTHDLRVLLGRLGVHHAKFDSRSPVAPALKMVLEWRREHGYAVGKLPLKSASQFMPYTRMRFGLISSRIRCVSGPLMP
jgi:hypothetical protein